MGETQRKDLKICSPGKAGAKQRCYAKNEQRDIVKMGRLSNGSLCNGRGTQAGKQTQEKACEKTKPRYTERRM